MKDDDDDDHGTLMLPGKTPSDPPKRPRKTGPRKHKRKANSETADE